MEASFLGRRRLAGSGEWLRKALWLGDQGLRGARMAARAASSFGLRQFAPAHSCLSLAHLSGSQVSWSQS